ncbi:MAG: hypothetical protein U0234_03730 [Sandaracinus sp.]
MLPRLAVVLVSCALVAACAHTAPPPRVQRDPYDAYASAVEESVWLYERESDQAVRGMHPLASGRYEQLLRDCLAERGLTLDQFRALGRTAPRFYFTQQALYALRLEAAEARAVRGAARDVDPR